MIPVVLVPTYARIQHLQTQLACLLAQDHPCEVLVLNDCPRQRLQFDNNPNSHVRVRILNVQNTFRTLGEKRNHLLSLAGTRTVMWADDDDLCLPWYVRGLLHASRATGWSWCSRSWYLHEKWLLTAWVLYCCGPADQWLMRGGAPADDCGEDQGLRAVAMGRRPGPVEGTPGYVYQWGQGTHHVSGQGDKRGGVGFRAEAEKRMNEGLEPTGDIHLVPTPRSWDDAPTEVLSRL